MTLLCCGMAITGYESRASDRPLVPYHQPLRLHLSTQASADCSCITSSTTGPTRFRCLAGDRRSRDYAFCSAPLIRPSPPYSRMRVMTSASGIADWAGGLAGAISRTATAPIDRLRMLQQVNNSRSLLSMRKARLPISRRRAVTQLCLPAS